LLEDIGTDVVELTGDHFHDWGAEAMLFTLDMYRERGWPYYGGGATFDEGKQAALLEHNGNRIAFIGCNGKGGGFAQAGPSNPGSVHCDWDWIHGETRRLAEEGYLVIATFQHHEYYSYEAPSPMWGDFRGMSEAGAVVVSGSQAHHPHGFEFWEGALIHYGLGNLFFDQLGISPGTGQAFIDRHVFYNGRYLGVELLTIQFEDLARARPMSPAEREDLLRLVFGASGW
jgi:poly-gamma-glutamate synthesis protein (capsule biosynthesis protein)